MHLHILGIGGTFMSALAILAREAGFTVTGCDANLYPPVSTLLTEKGIDWVQGYDDATLALQADKIIVGNAIKRGISVLEEALNHNISYISGPQWLAENILTRYRVLAVAGTHGKTTTTSLTAFILSYAGLNPGFLIGGVASNFNTSAKLGSGEWFVIEADEYDSAYFDKRPKLMHYRPEISILNNLEFDHADIYPNLTAIEQQFHYYLKTIPAKGIIIKPKDDESINRVIKKGLYSRVEELSTESDSDWTAQLTSPDGSSFDVFHKKNKVAEVFWSLIGQFNVENALAAMAASFHAGVSPEIAANALKDFVSPKRRLELKATHSGITLYDDFAHHPTAISKTINALKLSQRHQRVVVVVEFASFSMRTGAHREALKTAFDKADEVYLLNSPDLDLQEITASWSCPHVVSYDTSSLIKLVLASACSGDAILVMSNRGFDNIHQKIIEGLSRNI